MDTQALNGQNVQAIVHEATQLVQALNSPGNASAAKSIQDRLLVLQKSEAGWVIADGLLNTDDPNSRFFGALTLTIKIHQAWDTLCEEKAKDLLARLIDCFVLQVDKNETIVVLRKLMSTMSTLFFKTKAPWTHCIRHTAMSLANRKYVLEEQCDQNSFGNTALLSLNYEQMQALLTFSATLAEDSLRHNLSENNDLLERLEENLNDAFYLVYFVLQRIFGNDGAVMLPHSLTEQSCKMAIGAIKAFHAWLVVMRISRTPHPDVMETISISLDCVVQFLAAPAVAPASMDVVADIIGNQQKLMGEERMNLVLVFLTGELAEKYAMGLLKGDYEEENMRFLELLLRYATAEQLHLMSGPANERVQKLILMLHNLFFTPGFPEVDDKSSTLVLEFWTEVAESLYDAGMEDNIVLDPGRIKMAFGQVITNCYDKLRYPNPSVLEDWDDDDLKNFNGFRRDFADFLLATYPLLGVEVIQKLQEVAVGWMEQEAWDSVEVAIFCLASLAESIAENPHGDNLLHKLFYSRQFEFLCSNRQLVSTKTRQTLCDMVARYTSYFERNQELLPRAVNFLFNSLETPGCEQAASKAISVLCQNCRQALPVYVSDFIDKFDQLRANPSMGTTTIERVAEGIAAVTQAVSEDSMKATCLMRLLGPLHQLAKQANEQAQSNQFEEGLAKGLVAIRCTASIGKGFRSQDDGVIDLDSEGANPNAKTFWNSVDLGTSTQAFIVQILELVVGTFSNDGDIIEAACDVLKAGYTEHTPGPYVLSPRISVQFVKAVDIASPQFPTVMGTASAFLASHATHASEINSEAMELIVHVYEVMCYMNINPQQYDPEVAHSCTDFLNLLLPKYQDVFFSLAEPFPNRPPIIPTILEFTLATLKGPDPLPLRSAAAFWTTLLSLPNAPPEFQPTGTEREMKAHGLRYFDNVLHSLGAQLMHQIAGNCARSDIDHLCEVIKKFIFKHQGAARLHFSDALSAMDNTQGPEAANSPPSKADREKFLSSILALRGMKTTNKVVKEFWVLCRGSGFGYT